MIRQTPSARHLRDFVTLPAAAMLLTLCSFAAFASEPKDMIGKWRWKQFMIEVSECQGGNICAKIVEGPKNVGMQVFATNLTAKDGDLFGQVAHPETKEIYNTRFRQDGADKWQLDGCTAARVCLSGEFARIK
jgi:uncharacterized protein (DUF2147 family)